ncbi:MAG: GTP cyclohydrolase I FolE2 [Treponema sp.]|nr:GTP cyclohydrolase I FolE2 [Treponema sp.]
MIDIQNQADNREIPLQKVGVRGLRYPVKVLDKKNKVQTTTANADLFVNLPHHYKGTHMSRFVEIFHAHHRDLSMKGFLNMLNEVRIKLKAERAFAVVRFPFFMEKTAPVSKNAGMMCYECTYEGTVTENSKEFYVTVEVPVTTLCPCSKAISKNGAHNQRGIVRVKVRNTHFFWIEDIIAEVENSASSALYSILKRDDEKFVTEQAYANPRFVEDVAREVYIALQNMPEKYNLDGEFSWFSVEAENYESIHNHNAYAYVEK